jgi:hypothetical protein
MCRLSPKQCLRQTFTEEMRKLGVARPMRTTIMYDFEMVLRNIQIDYRFVFSELDLSLSWRTLSSTDLIVSSMSNLWNWIVPSMQVYGMFQARSTYEGMLLADANKRPFVLTRAAFIGAHRYAATWTGDNLANWEHLGMSIPMALNLVCFKFLHQF